MEGRVLVVLGMRYITIWHNSNFRFGLHYNWPLFHRDEISQNDVKGLSLKCSRYVGKGESSSPVESSFIGGRKANEVELETRKTRRR